jgi:uncharacterized protein YaiL (DUF2058 family)
MSDSLRDQLLGLGFKSPPKPERKPEYKPAQNPRPQSPRNPNAARQAHLAVTAQAVVGQPRTGPNKPRTREDIDLAKAYAIRAQREKDERIAVERQKQEEARKRREAKTQLAQLLQGKSLNDPAAEIARHFDYGDKIKRVYVTAAQLKALNEGELGVVQLDGRYLLIDAGLLAQAEAVFAPAIALKVDPDATSGDDPYADPQYRVPDDLVW